MPLLIFIYYMMGLLICEYEEFWPEVIVESLRFRWPLRPEGLLLENFSWYKAGKFYEDNEYLYAIMLKGWWSVCCDGWLWLRSTPRKEDAKGAHTTDRWHCWREHNKDPLTCEVAMSSELRISYIICVACLIKMEYFSAQKFQKLGTAGIQLEGRSHKRSTPGIYCLTTQLPISK